MLTQDLETALAPQNRIGPYSFDEFIEQARIFHGYPAPGLILGAYMVDAALRALPRDILFDSICETSWCLPDAVQMLTPCSVGNGWLKITNLGIYAVSLYDKNSGDGVRVWLDMDKIHPDSEIRTWLMKTKPKPEQDSKRLRREIREAGASICSMRPVRVRPEHMVKRSKGRIVQCPLCNEPYPAEFGSICRSCQGQSPYEFSSQSVSSDEPKLEAIDAGQALGKRALHDMTRVVPGVSKGPEFKRGHVFSSGDVCRLQRMGRSRVYLDDQNVGDEWVHEDTVAQSMVQLMCGKNTEPEGNADEGKVNIKASCDGLFVLRRQRLLEFNHIPGVMCATRNANTIVTKGARLAGTRAIPLYLARNHYEAALALLDDDPLFAVHPLRQAKAGLLITGTEVFRGLIDDKFGPVLTAKLAELGSDVLRTQFVPDDRAMICKAVEDLVDKGCDLIITTAGLSVDPDDVTRKGLQDAGVTDMLYGMPVLPGAMALVAHIKGLPVLGVPACALYHKTTSLDLLLPRVLAGVPITRTDLAELGEGGLCRECKTCIFPKCSFGK